MLKYGIRVVAMFFCTVLTMGVVLAADCNGGTSTKKTDTTCIEQGLRAAVALSDRMYLEVMKKINPKDRALMQKTWGEWAVEHSDICKLTLDTEERIRWVNAARKDINKAACLWLLISRDNNGLESMLGKNSSPQPEFNFDFWSGLYANPTKPVSFTEVLEPASVPLPSAALDPKQVAGVAPAKVAALNLKFFPAFANYERNLQLYESGDSKLTLEQVYTEAVNLEEPWIADIDALYRAGEASGVPLEDQPEYKP